MFDIGFSELLLFGVIALIVLGPEKLPQAARTAGQWYAKIRRTVSTLQSEIEAELDLAETRQQMQKELAKIRQTEAEMRREMAEMRGSMQEFESSKNQHLKASRDLVDDAKPRQSSQGSSENDDNRPVSPKSFDYAYDNNRQAEKPESSEQPSAQGDNDSLKTDFNDNANPVIQTITTRPWENMWFRLGAYDKARRLPQPPYLPNYKADILLNSHIDSLLPKQASVNEQESH
ncbi:Sec-independent protein translocase protein TatB [Psychrobacter cryohalolentis]|uniref:Sec-independent protein translocase protein TatB n=1 Tax=Psychrobacter cryohalolentis (strain ATCC BAA-1226 / DSM 17306 / VKM B-2378 / K5) TaxID=335284 RepID=TATB_PSYCK|nr:Sec-independent protein translocase protein TatB [Psychrobacter cryohalolentis]Q1Q8C2.1 RecName: Full=Sec-independent protein translocase protein TatB [Psychrobacter cryohalolentis K5]ABE76081.1 Sec-independent protein translocase TatB [Psychrobacter cryohalolentis K5]ASE26257.1 twin-arginine translocase subunit TatB [Psychrobacter cryohalolentis]